MSKKAIWGIISLMTISLLGIIILQASWIIESLNLSQKQFDNKVDELLNDVSEHLDEYDENYTLHMALSLPLNTSINQEFTNISTAEKTVPLYDLEEHFENEDDINSYAKSCNCLRCKAERMYRISELSVYKNTQGSNRTIDERIDNDFLDTLLKQELHRRNLHLDFNYGIYSVKKKDFVIKNGMYYVASNSINITPGEFNAEQASEDEQLYHSKYKISLFSRRDFQTPGFLMIHFPNRTQFVWRSVLLTFLASLLFTGIILFCFIYTVRVILHQKKVSIIKNDFINNMTHEFKTPIATISLASDSITNPVIINNKDKVERFANIIKQENRRMNNQVEKVLQMALIDKKNFELKLSGVNIHQVIRNAVQNINLQLEKKDGLAIANLDANKEVIEGDLTHISNVINNLLDNANKYTPKQPKIQVSTKDKTDGIEISVKDNGIGMNKEARKHIFDKFYRVSTGNLHDVKGFGLGLSYVKAIMNAHNGQINVKSELGKGSEFILFFPYKVQAS